jgi:hypothetical protein
MKPWAGKNPAKLVLVACAVLACTTILFPHWTEEGAGHFTISIGYGFLLTPPKTEQSRYVDTRRVDVPRTGLSLFAIFIVAGVATVLLRSK